MKPTEHTTDKDKLRKEAMRSLKFTLFSLSAGVIQLASDALLNEVVGCTPAVASLIALVLSVIWNFTLNRKYTFHSAANVPIAMLKVALFYAVFALLSTWWTHVLTDPAGIGWHWLPVQILTMFVNFITEFLYQRFFVFSKSLDTAPQKEKK